MDPDPVWIRIQWGPWIGSNFNFLSRKDLKHFFNCIVFQFFVTKTLDPDPYPGPDSLEMLDLDPDSMNPDPQHC